MATAGRLWLGLVVPGKVPHAEMAATGRSEDDEDPGLRTVRFERSPRRNRTAAALVPPGHEDLPSPTRWKSVAKITRRGESSSPSPSRSEIHPEFGPTSQLYQRAIATKFSVNAAALAAGSQLTSSPSRARLPVFRDTTDVDEGTERRDGPGVDDATTVDAAEDAPGSALQGMRLALPKRRSQPPTKVGGPRPPPPPQSSAVPASPNGGQRSPPTPPTASTDGSGGGDENNNNRNVPIGRSMSFRTLALRAVESRNRRERFQWWSRMCCRALESWFLALFVVFLLGAAAFDTLVYGTANFALALGGAIVMYVVPIFPIWLGMILLLFRGRITRRFSDIVRIHRLFGRLGPTTRGAELRREESSVVVSMTPFQQHHRRDPAVTFTDATLPARSSRRRFDTAVDHRVLAPTVRRPGGGGNVPPPGQPQPHAGDNEDDDDVVAGLPPLRYWSGGGVAPGGQQQQHVPVRKRSDGDVDFLYYYWSSQKQRMKRGQLQADSVRHVETTGFAVPSVMTTGQIAAPASTYSGHYPRPPRDPTDLSSRRALDMIYQIGSCPTLSPPALETIPGYQLGGTTRGTSVFEPAATQSSGQKKKKSKLRLPREVLLGYGTRRRRGGAYGAVGTAGCCTREADGSLMYGLALSIWEFPPFQISLVLRNFGWCAQYIWSTTLIYRSNSREIWDVSGIPDSFRALDAVFMWMITWDYIINLLAAADQLKFIVNFASIVDLLTMPPAKLVAAMISPTIAEQYPIYTGSLRILRLARIENTLAHVVPWISIVKLRIISLAIGAFVITLMFASSMFAFEAPYGLREGFTTLYDFVFFALVTISTVGYGDFSPTKTESKAIVMFAIVVALAFLPTQIQKLITALQTPPVSVGRVPHDYQDYIAIAGPIEPRQLVIVCRELANSIPGCCSSILVITPGPVNIYRDVIRTAFTRARINIAAVQAEASPSKTRPYFKYARAVFIVGSFQPHVDDPTRQLLFHDPEADHLDDDQNTLMRFIGAQQVCWPDKPICVQLNDGTTKHLVTEMGAYNVVCLQHVKMKLLAKSCSGCPGFITLISNLFYQPLQDVEILLKDDLTVDSEITRNTKLYFRGTRYQIYRLEFPECFYGLQFTLLARVLAAQYGVYLIGVSCVSKEYWLNPVGYKVGDELESFTDWPFAGIVLAPSLSVVQTIASLTNVHLPDDRIALEEQYMRRKNRDRASCVSSFYRFTRQSQLSTTSDRYSRDGAGGGGGGGEWSLSTTTPSMRDPFVRTASHSRVAGTAERREHVDEVRRTTAGIMEVPDVEAARRYVFKEPHNDLIVTCGWPRGIQIFFAATLTSQKCNVIILAPIHPSGLSVDALLPFADMCAWVRGSGLDVTDLVRAGVLQAKSCCVFSCMHVPWCQDVSKQRTDTQAILVREFIYALHHSDSMLERRLQHLIQTEARRAELQHTRTGRSMTEDFITLVQQPAVGITREGSTTAAGLDATTTTCAPLVFVELRSENRVEFLDVTPVKTAGAFFTQSEVDSIWSQHGLFMANPEYTSGRVLLEEMFYGLICFSLPISRFCTDSRIIDHLVSGTHIPLPEGFPPSCPLWMETLPTSYVGLPFSARMDDLLKDSLKFPIGIYRQTRKLSPKRTPLDLLQGEDAFQYVVISCPPLDMTLQVGDQVYVIHACPAEAIGLLLSTASG